MHPLCSAQPTASSDANLALVLICVAAVAGAAILAMVPLAIAAARRHRAGEALMVAVLAWCLVAAGSGIRTAIQRNSWLAERDLRLKTGYYDEAEADADAPKMPVATWAVLGAAYLGLIAWAGLRGGHRREGAAP